MKRFNTARLIGRFGFRSYLKSQAFLGLAISILTSCSRPNAETSGPLPQRGYIWQREWTPAVIDSLVEAKKRMSGVVVLGTEVNFATGKAEIAKASIDWEALKQSGHCSLALRVAPLAGPFRADDGITRAIVGVTRQLLDDARTHGVQIEEFQFDFDCAANNLGNYRAWLSMLRETVHPIRFALTVLPAWLSQSEFLPLVREADVYVLQVHSVPFSSGGAANLCHPRTAEKWVAQAAKLGIPFSVALPTYRCSAGYGGDGKLLSVAMDSVQPIWPPGTRVLEFGANADEIASLVRAWQKSRPRELRELLWYRVPIATDTRNWRWPILSAVMAGRFLEHKLNILHEGENPIDLSIFHAGEADEELNDTVTATWNDSTLTAADALIGWTVR